MIHTFQKERFRYPKCQGGQLHQGQVLNLVCVDQKCDHRGIICPVCQMQSHEGHHILPIKIFLAQIRDSLTNNDDSQGLNNLGDYLRSLEKTKKTFQKFLTEQINELSLIFKDIEVKLQSAYLSIRRNVMIQSALSSKLPLLLEDLVRDPSCDPFNLQREFSKYCELIKYKDSKLKVSGKGSILVDKFKNIPQKIKDIMSSCLTQYKKRILDAGKKFTFQEQAKEDLKEKAGPGLTFSSNNKNKNVILSQAKDEAWLQEGQIAGFVFIEQAFTPTNNKVTLDIVRLSQRRMMLGVGKNIQLNDYPLPDQKDKEKLQLYLHADGLDYITPYDEQSGIEQGFFCFNQGNQVTIVVDFDKDRCSFSTTHIGEPYWLDFKSNIKQELNLKLCIGLDNNDRVKIRNLK